MTPKLEQAAWDGYVDRACKVATLEAKRIRAGNGGWGGGSPQAEQLAEALETIVEDRMRKERVETTRTEPTERVHRILLAAASELGFEQAIAILTTEHKRVRGILGY
jgi:hypothetical protein